jgi:hypothetical protein
MIRIVHSGSGSSLYTHPGSRIQGSKGIPDPDPQHWLGHKKKIAKFLMRTFTLAVLPSSMISGLWSVHVP